MNITPKKLAIQKAMLLRLYPGMSLEEAIENERFSRGCIVQNNEEGEYGGVFALRIDNDYNQYIYCHYNRDDPYGGMVLSFSDTYLSYFGLPPTLSRVLTALGNNIILGTYEGRTRIGTLDISLFDRKLRNDGGTDATLRDQSQETQDAVGKLFGVE